jgi:peroxiredoxin
MTKVSGNLFGLIALSLLICTSPLFPQKAKEILLDPNGNVISSNEFRDYSLSDPQRKAPFTRTTLQDGTVEIRLKKNLFEGNTAVAFGVQTIDGKTIPAAALKGKVLVMNFWFIGCPGCMEEIPKLNDLAAKFADRKDVVFIALSLDPAASVADFIKKVPFNYLHTGDAGPTADLFGVGSFPRNVVVGRDGKIVYWRSTVKAWEQFDAVIKAELGK